MQIMNLKIIKNKMYKNSETGKRIIINAAYLAFGSIIGKAAMFIVLILVARQFGPSNFGAYNTAFNHVFIMGIIAKMGFDMAIIREGAKNLNNASIIQNKIFPVRFWTSILIWILTIVSAFLLPYNETTIKIILIMSPIVFTGGAINSGIIEHFTSYFKIIEKMQYATYVLLFRTFIFAGAVSCLIFFKMLTLYNLSLIVVLSSLLALLFQILQARKFYKQEFTLKIDYQYIKPLIKPIILFGIVSILFEVSLRINIIMLSTLSNNIEAGLYSAAWNLVSIGTLFIASFSTSIFPNSARKIFDKDFRNKMFKGLLLGTLLFIIVCVISTFFSEYIVTFIYGNSYLKSGKVLLIIIWFLPFRLLSLYGHQILESANYLVIRILVFLIPTLLNIIINYFSIPRFGAIGSAYASLFSNAIILILAFIAGNYVIKKDKRFLK